MTKRRKRTAADSILPARAENRGNRNLMRSAAQNRRSAPAPRWRFASRIHSLSGLLTSLTMACTGAAGQARAGSGSDAGGNTAGSTLGPPGPAGSKGDKGDPGSAGATGPAGPPGLIWQGAWVAAKGYQGNAGVTYQGVSYVAIADNINETPPGSSWQVLARAGSDGQQGPVGPQGSRGDQGSMGLQGLQGPIGPQGPKGDQGSTGSQGLQGLLGNQGPKGDKGDSGTQGLAGTQGAPGPHGPGVVWKDSTGAIMPIAFAAPDITGSLGDIFQLWFFDSNGYLWKYRIDIAVGFSGPTGTGAASIRSATEPVGQWTYYDAAGCTGNVYVLPVTPFFTFRFQGGGAAFYSTDPNVTATGATILSYNNVPPGPDPGSCSTYASAQSMMVVPLSSLVVVTPPAQPPGVPPYHPERSQ
jgi:hypothetical protein